MKLGDDSVFKPRETSSPSLQSIHDKVVPADIRENERILARIRARNEGDAGEFEQIRVWRLSPLGVELLATEANSDFSKGASIDLELTIVGQRSFFQGLVVDVLEHHRLGIIYGIRLSGKAPERRPNDERRQSNRWLCSDQFLPVAVAPAPGRFDDFMHFKIRDISGEGFQLTTSLRNKFLVPGMNLKMTVGFPMGSVVPIDATIVRTSIESFGSSDQLVVGVTADNPSTLSRRVIGQYLIQFSNAESLDVIRQSGYPHESVSRSTTFYYLKSEEDYRAVLKLRLEANRKAGQLGNAQKPEDVGDIIDMHSRILVAKRADKVIGTARFRFAEIEEPLEVEKYARWPRNMPRRDEILEVSRLATDPSFRQSDLLAGLFKYACSTCLTPERPWIVMSCMSKYIPFYKKIGFRQTDIVYEDPHWSEPLNVMIADSYAAIKGTGVHPVYWNLIWREVCEFLAENGLTTLSRRDRLRMAVYRLFAPLAAQMLQRRMQKLD